MPGRTQSDLVAGTLQSLAYLALIAADSQASPIPRSIGARDLGTTSPGDNPMTAKNTLEWVFAAAAVLIIAAGFAWRSFFLRVRNRPLRDFFAFIEAPQQRGSSARPSPGGLTPIPLGQRRRVLTRAADVDSGGRRGGRPDPDDAGSLTEKDVLPAYEIKGGPPNYSQFLAVNLGTSTNARLQITETVPVGASQSQSLETSSNPSVQTGLDVPLPPLPPPSYSPAPVTNHPGICYGPTDR
ncbi:hypothetical protein BJ322DRAFT_1079601 [Thelephora terrestris]|uniref:Uncharacterized protein n=1 Tax=Thelephora terrestris TaxID=56493 RepID=A0A9P6H964_9AGAM|nr:hypothetical protein BJ322DRAFT_1079601 [Thelephora terrestris]